MDNLILLEYAEHGPGHARHISVVKQRGGHSASEPHELRISENGLSVTALGTTPR